MFVKTFTKRNSSKRNPSYSTCTMEKIEYKYCFVCWWWYSCTWLKHTLKKIWSSCVHIHFFSLSLFFLSGRKIIWEYYFLTKTKSESNQFVVYLLFSLFFVVLRHLMCIWRLTRSLFNVFVSFFSSFINHTKKNKFCAVFSLFHCLSFSSLVDKIFWK